MLLTDKLFVYGTLKKDFSNHNYLKSAKYLYDAFTLTKFQMLNLGYYPALIKDEDGYSIKGEVYRITENILKNIDILEGYPDFYTRELITTNMSNFMVYIYYLKNNLNNYNKDYVKPIKGQKYLEWRERTNEFQRISR